LLFFAGIKGFGSGLTYLPPLICAWEWFPDYKGLITGLLFSGYGFSSFFFSLLSTELINPEDKRPSIYDRNQDVTYFDRSVAGNVPYMFRVHVFISTFFFATSILLMNRKPLTETSESRDMDRLRS
jgi:hypothetical protein